MSKAEKLTILLSILAIVAFIAYKKLIAEAVPPTSVDTIDNKGLALIAHYQQDRGQGYSDLDQEAWNDFNAWRMRIFEGQTLDESLIYGKHIADLQRAMAFFKGWNIPASRTSLQIFYPYVLSYMQNKGPFLWEVQVGEFLNNQNTSNYAS